MLKKLGILFASLTVLLVSGKVEACGFYVPPELENIADADLVVIGNLSNYRINRDMEFREERLADPETPVHLRQLYEDPKGSIGSDFSTFNVEVKEVLVGKTSKTVIPVSWENSTFNQPEKMDAGSYLIGLVYPPDISKRKYVPRYLKAGNMHPLQRPCSSAFIMAADNPSYNEVRNILFWGPIWPYRLWLIALAIVITMLGTLILSKLMRK
ncbi:hypothetical protein N8940_02205 [Sphingomonadaceae bacterium]|nr:hypothetical protein [Sphingomonadaceae bacterium]